MKEIINLYLHNNKTLSNLNKKSKQYKYRLINMIGSVIISLNAEMTDEKYI